MPAVWLLLSIPAAIAVLAAVPALSAMVEEQFLSPRSLGISVIRTSRTTPEYAEAFIARELASLLDQQRH